LNEISKDSRKKFIIWGFEEPENSYELKNIKKLRNNFLDIYSIDKQIFITTHSRDFLSINDTNKKVSIYRIYKKADNSSQVAYYDNKNGFNKKEIQLSFWDSNKKTDIGKDVLNELFSDLGIIEESRNIIELEDLARERKNNSELKKIVISLKKPIIFVEDEKINLYIVITKIKI
jgi:hypothetical protein